MAPTSRLTSEKRTSFCVFDVMRISGPLLQSPMHPVPLTWTLASSCLALTSALSPSMMAPAPDDWQPVLEQQIRRTSKACCLAFISADFTSSSSGFIKFLCVRLESVLLVNGLFSSGFLWGGSHHRLVLLNALDDIAAISGLQLAVDFAVD